VLKVLVDEDMPRPTASLLKSLNIDAVDVRDVGLRGLSDTKVFEYAQRNGMIIISRDGEFGNILRYPPRSHCGIVLVKLPYTFVRHQILAVVEKFFAEVDTTRLPNNLTVLEVDRYRIRKNE
jgi:predicted nuclease of predicted toxin-antitoxin system